MQLYRFSYPISKPYPFRWFTPIVIVGGLVLTVVFSLINYPAHAYDMVTTEYADPANIEHDPRYSVASLSWWSSGDDLKPKCQPHDLSIGDRFFTTNMGFQYTVEKIYKVYNETQAGDVSQSVPYLNETLRDCRPFEIAIDVLKSDTVKPPTWWISWGVGSGFTAKAHCTLETATGAANIVIRMSRDKANIDDYNFLVTSVDPRNQASFWWGARLLNAYWFRVLTVLAVKGNYPGWGFFNRGGFVFAYDPSLGKSIHDVDFHTMAFHLISSSTYNIMNEDRWKNTMGHPMDQLYNNKSLNMSAIITEASYFAKVVHSFLAADLGNPDVPNMLLSETELRRFLNGTDKNINREQGGVLFPRNSNFWNVPQLQVASPTKPRKFELLEDSWDAYRSRLGPLSTQNAHVHRQYTCSVPRRRGAGRIFLLLLVADLVFLQAAWKLLNLAAEALVARQAPTTAMVCAGCPGVEKDPETPIEMQTLIPER